MPTITAQPSTDRAVLSETDVRHWIAEHVPRDEYRGKRVLLVIPDGTRTAPMPLLFSTLADHLGSVVAQMDLIVALGTHQPMSEAAILKLIGVSPEDRATRFANVGLFNHEWDNPAQLATIGTLTTNETAELSEERLSLEVPVEINRRVLDYDVLLVVGPVFPHEVVGFSGGNKYYFPGISGPKLLNFFHWLGALVTNVGIIGVKDTPVRKVVERAAKLIPIERRCLAFVVRPDAALYGLFYGTPEQAWSDAADLSSTVHITRKPRAFHTVLSCAPPMYDELWVAGKCMYKLEPVVADGGELIIYAPHMHEVSLTHGKLIREVGYHCRDYFVKQWDRFKHYPWGTLANAAQALLDRQTVLPGLLRPGIVHRLDRETSGVIVIAKNDVAHAGLTESFERSCVAKTYLALVAGRMKGDKRTIRLPIGGRNGSVLMSANPDAVSPRDAETCIRVLRRFRSATLVEALPRTGRKHQIRVHLAAIGHPILGDASYLQASGGRQPPEFPARSVTCPQRHALHAAAIAFRHPITQASLRIVAPVPKDFWATLVCTA
jgi:RluA family pseudouridine synthase